jgi:hypothetical protein
MSTLLRQLKGESQRYTNMASYGLGKLLGSAAERITELENKCELSARCNKELDKTNNQLEGRIAELEKAMDGICIAVFDNRGKAVTEATVSLVRAAVGRFELPLDFKQKEQEL